MRWSLAIVILLAGYFFAGPFVWGMLTSVLGRENGDFAKWVTLVIFPVLLVWFAYRLVKGSTSSNIKAAAIPAASSAGAQAARGVGIALVVCLVIAVILFGWFFSHIRLGGE